MEEERRKWENRLLLILGLILVNLEVSEGVGVFGGSDDSVESASERSEGAIALSTKGTMTITDSFSPILLPDAKHHVLSRGTGEKG